MAAAGSSRVVADSVLCKVSLTVPNADPSPKEQSTYLLGLAHIGLAADDALAGSHSASPILARVESKYTVRWPLLWDTAHWLWELQTSSLPRCDWYLGE